MQNDAFNESAINTVVVCALTTNLRRARIPGNVLLDEGEADLPEQSVVVVSQLSPWTRKICWTKSAPSPRSALNRPSKASAVS